MRLLLLLGFVGLCLAAAAGEIVTWKAGSAYSDTFLYNGFSYKTIRIFDTNSSGLSLSLAVAPGRDNSCPGPGRHCTASLVLAMNEGTTAFNLNPDQLELTCTGDKPKTLKHYSFPRFLRGSATASGVVLLANTIVPTDKKSGAVFFSGSCPDYTVRVPIEAAGRRLVFEFPFETARK